MEMIKGKENLINIFGLGFSRSDLKETAHQIEKVCKERRKHFNLLFLLM